MGSTHLAFSVFFLRDMQADVLGCVCSVQHLGGVYFGSPSLDPLLLRPQARLPLVVLPAADPGAPRVDLDRGKPSKPCFCRY